MIDITEFTITDRFRPGQGAGFLLRIGSRSHVTQFAVYDGTASGRGQFRFYWETHLDQIGGPLTVATAAVLETDPRFAPISYEVFSSQSPLKRVQFAGMVAHLTLSDDSSSSITLKARPDLVLQQNVVLQLGMLLALLPNRPGRYKLNFYSPEALTVKPLEVITTGDGRWGTSLGFEITCGPDGQVLAMRDPLSSVSGERIDAKFPDVPFESLRAQEVPDYKQPQGIAVEEIVLEKCNVPLEAALTLPAMCTPDLPGFVFIQGSGVHDRHGRAPGIETGVHEICDALTYYGFAGLRYGSRGTGRTPLGTLFESRIRTRLDDARCAFRYLQNRREVNPVNLFLIGHSLGAFVAVQLAAELGPEQVAGVVLLAPPWRRMDRIIIDQVVREAQRLGLSREQVKAKTQQLRKTLAEIAQLQDTDEERLVTGLTRASLHDLLQIDMSLIRSLRVPLLICQGTKDIQVSLQRDAVPLFLEASRAGISSELHVFSHCDHLFKQELEEPSPARYYVRRPVADGVVPVIAAWLRYASSRRRSGDLHYPPEGSPDNSQAS